MACILSLMRMIRLIVFPVILNAKPAKDLRTMNVWRVHQIKYLTEDDVF